MKVIDLLNKIANGRTPKLIKYDNLIWKYRKQFGDYTDTEKYLFCDYMADKENIILFLNDEIEIIEEDKKIEKILISIDDNSMPFVGNDKYQKLSYSEVDLLMASKINELIDKLNKEEK